MDVIDDLSETLAPAAALMLMSLSWLAISGRIPGLRDWILEAVHRGGSAGASVQPGRA
jgi:hypothetical protein